MGRIQHKYEKVAQLHPAAIPVSEYADLNKTNRSYIHIKYQRYKKGFVKNGTKYFGADPGYTIINYHGNCYVIENQHHNGY